MMTSIFWIKRGDTSPALRLVLTDAQQVPIDLQGATARFHMAAMGGTVVVDAAAMIEAPGSAGIVRYTWAPGDTATAGRYRAEFEIAYADGTVETFPNSRDIDIRIAEDLA